MLIPPRCLACRAFGCEPFCHSCRDELTTDDQGHELMPGVIAVAAFVYQDPIAVAIKRVKTDALRSGARALAGLLSPHVPAGAPRTYVPAPASRRRRRGLDLPQVLAGEDALRLLRNTRARTDQGELDARARRRSAVGAFTAEGVVPPSIVLVDDVRATGATLLAAALALRRGGARRVVAIALAASAGAPSAAWGATDGPAGLPSGR